MSENPEREGEMPPEIVGLTAKIVAAYVSHNTVSPADLPDLIRTIHRVISDLASGQNGQHDLLAPAVPIKKSITPEYIICLEDGKKLKMLKRYLRSQYDMSPEDYRTKWGLPADYPMVAPNYAAQRSQLAKEIGLGQPSKPKRRRT